MRIDIEDKVYRLRCGLHKAFNQAITGRRICGIISIAMRRVVQSIAVMQRDCRRDLLTVDLVEDDVSPSVWRMVMYLARSSTIEWRARKPGLRLTDWGSGSCSTTAAGIKTGELVFVQKRARQGILEPHTVARRYSHTIWLSRYY
jgi:hypothetical protein